MPLCEFMCLSPSSGFTRKTDVVVTSAGETIHHSIAEFSAKSPVQTENSKH